MLLLFDPVGVLKLAVDSLSLLGSGFSRLAFKRAHPPIDALAKTFDARLERSLALSSDLVFQMEHKGYPI